MVGELFQLHKDSHGIWCVYLAGEPEIPLFRGDCDAYGGLKGTDPFIAVVNVAEALYNWAEDDGYGESMALIGGIPIEVELMHVSELSDRWEERKVAMRDRGMGPWSAWSHLVRSGSMTLEAMLRVITAVRPETKEEK